jgi:hypothetical protein
MNDAVNDNVAEVEDAPAEPRKRGRGRPRGYPKSPLSGRQKKILSQAEARLAIMENTAAFKNLCDIANGKPVYQSGPTGKEYRAPAPLREQLKANEILMSVSMPALAATAVTGADNGPIKVQAEEIPTRQLARGILDIFSRAQLAQPKPAAPVADDEDEDDDEDEEIEEVVEEEAAPGSPLAKAAEGFAIASAANYAANIVSLPDPYASQSETGEYEDDTRLIVDGASGWLEFVAWGANRWASQWWVCDDNGRRIAQIWGKTKAEAALRELHATGKLTR